MRIIKFPALVAAPLLLAACSTMGAVQTDPALSSANITLPESFAFAPDIVAQDRSALKTLLPVDDQAFIELRQMATDDAPTLEAALARIDVAIAQADRASANRRPNITADASITGTRLNPDSFGGNLPAGISIDRYQTSFGGNILASWNSDIFGQLRASERAATIRISAATADAAAVRQGLVAAIAANVTDWKTVTAREEVLENDLASATELYRLTNTRAKAGLVPGFDAVQAETLLAQVKAQAAPLYTERARIAGALVTLTGKSTHQVMASLSKASSASGLLPVTLTTPATMLRARPDIAAAEARLAAADADIAGTAAQRFPTFNLSATLGILAFALGDVLSADTIVGSLGAGIAGPLLDFGRIDAEIDGSKARAKEAFAVYRGTVFTALGDAETAYGQVEGAREEVMALEKQIALEEDAIYLASIRYKRGLVDFRTVLNAQRQLNIVNTNVSLARGRHERARVALWLALGGS